MFHDFVERIDGNDLDLALPLVVKHNVLKVGPRDDDRANASVSCGFDLGRHAANGQHLTTDGE